MPSSECPGLPGWQRFIGRWETAAATRCCRAHDLRGHTTFEWLDGHQFVIQRSHYDLPEIPDAIAIIGVTGGQLSMHYFDSRGIYRVYAVSLEGDQWRFWRDDPGFRQQFTGDFSADGDTITGQGRMARDGAAGRRLAVTYRRVPQQGGSPPVNSYGPGVKLLLAWIYLTARRTILVPRQRAGRYFDLSGICPGNSS